MIVPYSKSKHSLCKMSQEELHMSYTAMADTM